MKLSPCPFCRHPRPRLLFISRIDGECVCVTCRACRATGPEVIGLPLKTLKKHEREAERRWNRRR